MKKINLIIGSKYGRWTILKEVPKINGERYILCRCSCGREKVVNLKNVIYGKSLSCGCLNSEIVSEKNRKNKKHGLYGSRIYRIWRQMKARCYNSESNVYKYYGGRGISVCDEWLNSVQSFYQWAINNGYKDNLTIDRIDSNKDYFPENCRWATIEEQQRNKRNNIKIIYDGKERTISEISKITGDSYNKIFKRIKRGKSLLVFVLCIFLSCCSYTNASLCPRYPVAGKKVADELKNVPYDQAPNFWEWLGRIDKLRQELELCRK